MVVATIDEVPAPATPPASSTVRISCRMPAVAKWCDYVLLPDGRVATVTHIWALKGVWCNLAESKQQGWAVRDFGLFVLAGRVEG